MGNSRNTLSTSKRRRSGESGARRLSNRTTTSSLSRLPSPAVLSRKHRETHGGVKCLALCTLLLIFLATTSSWRKRYLRSKTLSEDPFSTKSVEQHSFGHTKVKSELTRLQSHGSADRLNKVRMNTQRVREIAEDEDQEYAHVDHKQLNSLPSEHTQSTLAETSAGHGHETSSGNIDESMKSSASMSLTTPGTGGSENSGQVIVHEEHTHEQKKITGQTIGNDKVTPKATSQRQTIREFPDQIEWISREDLKSGTRPACRISKPCILSSGVIAVPAWMKRSENLLHRCGIGGHTFYNVAEPIKGVVHLREIDADFALTIQLKKFQEPTHISSVFLTEHILKASFLFDTFSHYLKVPDGVKIDHCIANSNGTECLSRENLASVHFQPAIFVPKRVEQGKPTLWSRKFVDMFGSAHGFDGSVVHLNVSTTLVKSHDNKIENLSATCFRSMLTADAMFRHLPNASLSTSSFFSRKNGIDRSQRAKVEDGTCSISMGILDLNEGPRGIIGTNDLKSRIQQFVKLAIRSASVHVELIKPGDQGFPLDDQIRKIQELDVFISGSGDEMSSLAFLRQSGIAVEILQFGMKPDTHRSLAASLGIRYMSFQAKPETDTFKACIEGQILGMRRRGTLPDGENPPWYKDLVETWDGAAAEFALSGKSEFDILSNRTGIANFDSRHCAKMQGVRVSNEELARSIVLMAKDQCSHK